MIAALLPIAVFLSAAAALSVEIAIVRLGAPYVGQSLLPWSAAIASVLLGLTVGHMLGGMAGGPGADKARLRLWLALAWTMAGQATSIMPQLSAPIAEALSGEHGPGDGAVAALAALAFLPSVAAGFVLPLAIRLVIADAASLRTIAAIYAASAAGSVAGTAVTGFVLLEWVGAAGLTRAIALLWLTLAACAVPWRALTASWRFGVVLPVLMLAGVTAAFVALPAVCSVETRYTCIRFLDKALPGEGLLRFMILDEGVHSASDQSDPRRLHLGYAALADTLAQSVFATSADPRALVIGGGGATLPRAWVEASKPVSVTVAELDGKVASTAADRMWARSPRLTTIVGDGRAVLRGMPADDAFDVVLMDAYRTRSVPPHLVSREFDVQIARRLSDDGVFLSNVIDRADTMLLTLSIAATLREVFPAVDIWVSDAGGAGTTNVVVAAWRNPDRALRPDTLTVAATVMEAGAETRTYQVVWRRYGPDAAARQWPRACAAVLTDDWAPVDRLLAGRNACKTPPPG